MTRAASDYVDQDDVLAAITRHGRGDWGDVDDDLWATNDFAVHWRGRLRSEYLTPGGDRFLVVSDLTRSVTYIASPEDYS